MKEIGPKFGYYPEPTKTWLVVKPHKAKNVNNIFFKKKMKLASEGHRYFGRAVETLNFKNIHLKEKVTNWIREH